MDRFQPPYPVLLDPDPRCNRTRGRDGPDQRTGWTRGRDGPEGRVDQWTGTGRTRGQGGPVEGDRTDQRVGWTSGRPQGGPEGGFLVRVPQGARTGPSGYLRYYDTCPSARPGSTSGTGLFREKKAKRRTNFYFRLKRRNHYNYIFVHSLRRSYTAPGPKSSYENNRRAKSGYSVCGMDPSPWPLKSMAASGRDRARDGREGRLVVSGVASRRRRRTPGKPQSLEPTREGRVSTTPGLSTPVGCSESLLGAPSKNTPGPRVRTPTGAVRPTGLREGARETSGRGPGGDTDWPSHPSRVSSRRDLAVGTPTSGRNEEHPHLPAHPLREREHERLLERQWVRLHHVEQRPRRGYVRDGDEASEDREGHPVPPRSPRSGSRYRRGRGADPDVHGGRRRGPYLGEGYVLKTGGTRGGDPSGRGGGSSGTQQRDAAGAVPPARGPRAP